MILKFSGFGVIPLPSLTFLITPTAIGCSKLYSRALASLSTSSLVCFSSVDSILLTPKSPIVNVPD
tara:strand:+ start:231 stop:428 length:198 start_codon:yes stop_codon:yes gene_type:complete